MTEKSEVRTKEILVSNIGLFDIVIKEKIEYGTSRVMVEGCMNTFHKGQFFFFSPSTRWKGADSRYLIITMVACYLIVYGVFIIGF